MWQSLGLSTRRRAVAWPIALVLTVVACSTLTRVESPFGSDPSASYRSDTLSFNPLALRGFYIDPDTSAAAAAATAGWSGNELRTIADTAQARWMSPDEAVGNVGNDVHTYATAAAKVNKMPLLVLYAIPKRDCNGYAGGGFATADQYRAWIAALAWGIGTAPATIVVEPDALTGADCLSAADQGERWALLRGAVQTLTRNPSAVVYLDGGHSRWLSAEELARRLTAVGVGLARGFSLNTSNFFTTDEEIAYGERVSRLTHGLHYVIDTSRNGAGPARDGPLNWCNPPGRGSGAFPTTRTAGAHADAYLWIKHPGESDGECGRGEPRSGAFFVSYAIELLQHAAS
jgi:endoglucanase